MNPFLTSISNGGNLLSNNVINKTNNGNDKRCKYYITIIEWPSISI